MFDLKGCKVAKDIKENFVIQLNKELVEYGVKLDQSTYNLILTAFDDGFSSCAGMFRDFVDTGAMQIMVRDSGKLKLVVPDNAR